jgi:hypothetical protein
MPRPRKNPTKVARIDALVLKIAKRKARRKKMSLPDYLSWRLSQ